MLEKIANTATRLFEKLTNSGGNHMTPAVVLSIDGQAFGTQTMSRIIDVTVDDKRGFEADELTITLSDYDGALAIPSTDSLVKVWLGYVETGVAYKGEYKITGFEHSGRPTNCASQPWPPTWLPASPSNKKKHGAKPHWARLWKPLPRNTATPQKSTKTWPKSALTT